MNDKAPFFFGLGFILGCMFTIVVILAFDSPRGTIDNPIVIQMDTTKRGRSGVGEPDGVWYKVEHRNE